jgi:hypothetical protein
MGLIFLATMFCDQSIILFWKIWIRVFKKSTKSLFFIKGKMIHIVNKFNPFRPIIFGKRISLLEKLVG